MMNTVTVADNPRGHKKRVTHPPVLLKAWGPAQTALDTTCPTAAAPVAVSDYVYDDLDRPLRVTENLTAGEGGNRIIATANSAGTSLATYTYGPYGEPNVTVGSRFRYTGQQIIGQLNLYYYKARFYSPALGRFLQTDPIGYADDMNLYGYVGNDPINGIDPSGLAVAEAKMLVGKMGDAIEGQWTQFKTSVNYGLNNPLESLSQLPMVGPGVAAVGLGIRTLGSVVSRYGTTAERTQLLENVITTNGGLNTSQTVARQLAGPRNYIPSQSILDTVGSGARVADPQGVAGQFMYRAPAQFNNSSGTLEVLVHEPSGQVRHVLFRRGQ